MPASSLDVRGLTAGYRDTVVLEHVSFSVSAGERMTVLGRNGVGKTTLLASIAGLSDRVAGQILLDGVPLERLNTSARARHGVGYVPQTRDIFRSLTVEENLCAGLKGRPRQAVEEAYSLFPRLKERRRNFGLQLSGGEQQMLSIARSVLGRPSLLLLDEPLEGLAPILCDELMETLLRLSSDRSMTIVLVEQQIERALRFAESVLILDRGRVAWNGASSELDRQGEIIERYLGVSMLFA
jgi:branched-chain amino acid transport system ATP-binding protein